MVHGEGACRVVEVKLSRDVIKVSPTILDTNSLLVQEQRQEALTML